MSAEGVTVLLVEQNVHQALEIADVVGDVGEQVGRLDDHHRHHRGHQRRGGDRHPQEHDAGGEPPAPSAPVQVLDGRLQGHRDEQGHEDHVEETPDLDQEPHHRRHPEQGQSHGEGGPAQRRRRHLPHGRAPVMSAG